MKKITKIAIGVGLGVASISLAQGVQQFLSLIVNGKASTSKAVVLSGETYVSLTALKSAGVTATLNKTTLSINVPKSATTTANPPTNTAAGGANQRNAVEGCINEKLFNGVWALTVKKIELIEDKERDKKAWQVTAEYRNGTSKTIFADQTGLYWDPYTEYNETYYNRMHNAYLIMSDGTSLNIGPSEGSGYDFFDQYIKNKPVISGGALILRIKFYLPEDIVNDSSIKPVKFFNEVDKKVFAKYPNNKGLGYTVADPSFRVNLSCSK